MRKIVGKLFSALLLSLFKDKWIRQFSESSNILSVFYHRPNLVEFEKWVVWCKRNGFEFISTSQLGNILNSKASIDKKLIWLTFDDGWRNNYTEILPILTRHKIPATIFISTNLIEEGVFWLELVRLNSHLISIDPNKLKLSMENERIEFIRALKKHPDYVPMEREFMTWEELEKISSSPLVHIGNHTHNHVICTRCSVSQLEEEMANSDSLLRNHCRNYLNAFAYPNGDYNESTQQFFADKFEYVVLVEGRNISMDVSTREIPRICLGDNLSWQENIFIMFGYRSKLISLYQ